MAAMAWTVYEQVRIELTFILFTNKCSSVGIYVRGHGLNLWLRLAILIEGLLFSSVQPSI
jgi:hypothetical protein